MSGETTLLVSGFRQDDLYEQAASEFGAALDRLARAWEADPDKRRDLLQEIHFAVWRSFAHWDSRCSLRTWIYRVAHNCATSHVVRQRRVYGSLVCIEDVSEVPAASNDYERWSASDRLAALVRQLKPLDRQVIVAYLEGMDAASIGEISGLSPANVAMKVHRIKAVLARRFRSGVGHGK